MFRVGGDIGNPVMVVDHRLGAERCVAVAEQSSEHLDPLKTTHDRLWEQKERRVFSKLVKRNQAAGPKGSTTQSGNPR